MKSPIAQVLVAGLLMFALLSVMQVSGLITSPNKAYTAIQGR